MSLPSMARDRLENPVQVARAYVSTPAGVRMSKRSQSTDKTYHRIARRLNTVLVARLEEQEAPLRITRWVAWAPSLPDQVLRCDLILHLRRALPRPADGWPIDVELRAALELLGVARATAIAAGAKPPAPADLAAARYAEAMASAKRERRTRSSRSSAAAQPMTALTAKELALLRKVLRQIGG